MSDKIPNKKEIPKDVLVDINDSDNPDRGHNWVERLRRGDRVWLVKEERYAAIEWPFEENSSSRFEHWGLIGINMGTHTVEYDWDWGHYESSPIHRWSMDSCGNGGNGLPLIYPVKGYLKGNPKPIPLTEIRRLERKIELLEKKVKLIIAMR